MPKPLPPYNSNCAPACPFFTVCGGCSTQDLAYSDQCVRKDTLLKSLFAGLVPENTWQPFTGMEGDTFHHRNKIRFGFVETPEGIRVARHAKRSSASDIPVDTCLLADQEAFAIARTVACLADELKWSLYRPHAGGGWLKHVLIRQSFDTRQFLVSVVTDSGIMKEQDAVVSRLTQSHPSIRGIFHTLTWGTSAEPVEDRLLYGEPYLTEKIGDKYFRISLHAFFQTNARMVETLYRTVRNRVGNDGITTLWDLYAGSATIGIFLSDLAATVVCLENNPANIEDARANIEVNGAKNIEIIGDAVETAATTEFLTNRTRPDCIVVDPPRAGLSQTAVNLLLNSGSLKIIYVSCNPATCYRDLHKLGQFKYSIASLQGLDCFPHSDHCEMVAELRLR